MACATCSSSEVETRAIMASHNAALVVEVALDVAARGSCRLRRLGQGGTAHAVLAEHGFCRIEQAQAGFLDFFLGAAGHVGAEIGAG